MPGKVMVVDAVTVLWSGYSSRYRVDLNAREGDGGRCCDRLVVCHREAEAATCLNSGGKVPVGGLTPGGPTTRKSSR